MKYFKIQFILKFLEKYIFEKNPFSINYKVRNDKAIFLIAKLLK